jgi:hypothetical protein
MRTSSFAIAMLAATFELLSLANAQSNEVPPALRKSAECMFTVLQGMPDVSEPKLGIVTSEGWAHPFLEYRADEGPGKSSLIRFNAKKPDGGGFWFLAVKSGLGAPELHVTVAVVQKWKLQCGVDANVIFP